MEASDSDNASQHSGSFEIARIDHCISAEEFCAKFIATETPVILTDVARNWPATTKWNAGYLNRCLAAAPGVEEHTVYYQMPSGTLACDYEIPAVVASVVQGPNAFAMRSNTRIWVNTKGNVSHWHCDSKFENVFNVQITGRKRWCLISPHTPPVCYPFSNFALLEGDHQVLAHKRITQFTLEAGELLYLPPLWFHRVVALGKENINLNWVFTKRRTRVCSAAMRRELERYLFDDRLRNHTNVLLRGVYRRLSKSVPSYLSLSWPYDKLPETPVVHAKHVLLRRTLEELRVLVRAAKTLPALRRTFKTLDRVAELHRTDAV